MIAAIVLAAGSGRRFGGDKRRHLIDGVPMLTRTLATYRAVLDQVAAVIRPGEPEIAELALSTGCHVVEAVDAGQGQSRSLAAGVVALTRNPVHAGPAEDPAPIAPPAGSVAPPAGSVDGLLIGLGDMPFVTVETIRRLVGAMQDNPDDIVRPRSRGRFGNPVGFPKRLFGDLTRLDGDRGARQLVASGCDILIVDTEDRGILNDVDRPEHLDRGEAVS